MRIARLPRVSFHQPLTAQPWVALNAILRDPDNNLILFAGPSDKVWPTHRLWWWIELFLA